MQLSQTFIFKDDDNFIILYLLYWTPFESTVPVFVFIIKSKSENSLWSPSLFGSVPIEECDTQNVLLVLQCSEVEALLVMFQADRCRISCESFDMQAN